MTLDKQASVEKIAHLRQVFCDPPRAFRPVLFWLWNGRLTAERLEAQLNDIAAHGFGGVVIHPMGENFRLGDFLEGISPPYLSDEYFALVRRAVEHAASVGLRVWLYDEGGWPSGSAQGKVVEGHPELQARVLRAEPAGPEHFARDDVVAVCAVSRDNVRVISRPEEAGSQVAVAFVERVVDGAYPDLMNPAAVRRFIELTHERYAEAVGQYFGTVVPGIFTDEPRVAGTIGGNEIPWSPALAKALEHSAQDWREWLPCLFSSSAVGFDPFVLLGREMVAAARCCFARAVAEQFHRAYFEQLNDWCAAQGLLHTGHVGGEDNLADHVNGGFWHWFLMAGSLHVPGIDVIWRQLFPGQYNFSFPQLASSAVHLREKPEAGDGVPEVPLCVSESFAVYGYGATFFQLAWVAGFQASRGVDSIWPMYYAYDVSNGKCYCTTAHWGPGNPMWRRWDTFCDYLARLAAVVRAGNHAADVAVYYPIEAEWAFRGGTEAARAWESWRQICEVLHSNQVAFDIVDSDAISAAQVEEGVLDTAGQWYRAVIVPDCSVLPTRVLEKLWQLHESGGRVIFCGDPPGLSADGQHDLHAQLLRRFSGAAFTLDERTERQSYGTAAGPLAAATVPSVMDGITPAFFGPALEDVFAPAALETGAVVVVPEEETGRLGRLMRISIGRYGAVTTQDTPELRSFAAWLSENTWLQLLFNEGTEPLECRLVALGQEPFAVEKWDPVRGMTTLVAVCHDVAEPPQFTVEIPAGEVTVLVTRPALENERAGAVRAGGELVLFEALEPELALIVERCILADGSLRVERPNAPLTPACLGRWADLSEAADLSGTVAYDFTIPLAEEYVGNELWLDMGEVEYAAAVFVNGQRAGVRLWPPYRVEVSGFMRAGENAVVVEVTNTLAPQVLRPENVDQARERGWDNPYYRRVFPWLSESTGGGLIGPVRLICHFER